MTDYRVCDIEWVGEQDSWQHLWAENISVDNPQIENIEIGGMYQSLWKGKYYPIRVTDIYENEKKAKRAATERKRKPVTKRDASQEITSSENTGAEKVKSERKRKPVTKRDASQEITSSENKDDSIGGDEAKKIKVNEADKKDHSTKEQVHYDSVVGDEVMVFENVTAREANDEAYRVYLEENAAPKKSPFNKTIDKNAHSTKVVGNDEDNDEACQNNNLQENTEQQQHVYNNNVDSNTNNSPAPPIHIDIIADINNMKESLQLCLHNQNVINNNIIENTRVLNSLLTIHNNSLSTPNAIPCSSSKNTAANADASNRATVIDEVTKSIILSRLVQLGMEELMVTVCNEVLKSTQRHLLALSLLSILFSEVELLSSSYVKTNLKPLDSIRLSVIEEICFCWYQEVDNVQRKTIWIDIMVRIKAKARGAKRQQKFKTKDA